MADSRNGNAHYLSLVHTEILSVTTSIRKYSPSSSGSSSSGSAAGSTAGSSSVAGPSSLSSGSASGSGSSSSSLSLARPPASLAWGSHAASLTGDVIARARDRLASHGTEIDTDETSQHLQGLESALSARAKQVGQQTTEQQPRQHQQQHLYQPWALLDAFTILRAQLKEVHGNLYDLPLHLLVGPFLQVILSPRVSAPVTSAALQSIHRLLAYGILSDIYNHTQSRLAIIQVSRAISLCKFEPSEPSVDELVLLRIIGVMNQLICSSLSDVLPDESICEMMETALSMSCQNRLSDLLRKTAEQHILSMIRHIFTRIHTIPAQQQQEEPTQEEEDDAVSIPSTVADDDVKKLRRMTMPDPSGTGLNSVDDLQGVQSQNAEEQSTEESDSTTVIKSEDDNSRSATPTPTTVATQPELQAAPLDTNGVSTGADTTTQVTTADAPVQGTTADGTSQIATSALPPAYSLPAIKEILRVLISLLNPNSTAQNDSMRLLGLNLITAVFETSSTDLARFTDLTEQIQFTASKHLFQLARSESFAISTYAHRAILSMLHALKPNLKLQYELLLTMLFDRLAPTHPAKQEPWNQDTPRDSHSIDVAPTPPPPPPMPKSSDKAPAMGDTRDLNLETLAMLLADVNHLDPQIDPLLELFLNYDCDVDCNNMFVQAVHFLSRAVFAGPSVATVVNGGVNTSTGATGQDATQVLALDIILNFVERMTIRQEDDDDDERVDLELGSADSLLKSRERKDAIIEGARRFNAKPKVGLAYLEEQGFISSDSEKKAHSIASFLLSCPRLDKKLLGDYLTRPANADILLAFIEQLDFRGKTLAEAMREMLEKFRLPGESYQINSITETFSKVYFSAVDKNVIKSEDAVYVLAYSVIMLNTDLHNAQNKRKMKVEDYKRNLRGVNDGSDFDPEYLSTIYTSIQEHEIVMPEEHVGQLGFDYTWKELLRRSKPENQLLSTTSSQFDEIMFETSWKPLCSCIAYAFSTFRDEHLLERSISGFRQCALLASKFKLNIVFDYMINNLTSSTGLLKPTKHSQTTTVEVQPDPSLPATKVNVSSLSVKFGLDFKGQLAAVVLFTIANGNGPAIRSGWSSIFDIWQNLFAAGLLPSEMASMFDPVQASQAQAQAQAQTQTQGQGQAQTQGQGQAQGQGQSLPLESTQVGIPLKAKKRTALSAQDARAQQAGSGGLFSTLSSYLLSPYSTAADPAPPEVTHEDVESSLCTIDCITSCRIGELYSQLLGLEDGESFLAAIKALRQLADRLTLGQLAAAAAVAAASQQHESESSTSTGRSSTPTTTPHDDGGISGQRLAYDPRSVFVLELLTNMTCSSANIDAAWSETFAHLSSLLQSPRNFHRDLLERAVVCLLRLVEANSDSSVDDGIKTSRTTSALDLLKSLPSDIKPTLNASINASVYYIFSRPRQTALLQEAEQWTTLLSVVQDSLSTRSSDSIALIYNLISTLSRSHLTSTNFLPVVNLLREVSQSSDPEPMLTEVNKRERAGYRLTLTEKKELTEYVEMCRSVSVQAVQRLEEIGIDAQGDAVKHVTDALGSQCLNAHRATRQAALSSLQRVLTSLPDHAEHTSSTLPSVIAQIFHTTLFPILTSLSDSKIFPREQDVSIPGGLSETRQKALNLLVQFLCRQVNTLHLGLESVTVEEIWKTALDTFASYHTEFKKVAVMREVLTEDVRKVLLVFIQGGLLSSSGKMWELTREKLEKFLPGLLDDVMNSLQTGQDDVNGENSNEGQEGANGEVA
ncbi:unnamed protein product [Sympodiomycopsis kandeliae]